MSQNLKIIQSENTTVVQKYKEMLNNETLTHDPDQERVISILDSLATALVQANNSQKNLFKRLFNTKSNKPDGVYLYGGVGRGKSLLMDLFFDVVPLTRKTRTHFHSFMVDIHERIHLRRKENNSEDDPIEYVAKQIAKESSLLCFDEMQITDIADAMIIGRLFELLFEKNVVIVATSNRHPDDLYKHGLQREQFLPFIDMFKEKLYITPLDGTIDYRLQYLKSLSTVYFTPLGKKADTFIEAAFENLTNKGTQQTRELHMQGRILNVQKCHGDVAQFSFKELCENPLGSADFIEVAKEFNTVLLSNIPKMGKDHRNEAKRFINLIDELYEHKVKLICSAEAPLNELYITGDNSFEFERTVSRLIEMQSFTYLGKGHIG